MASGRSYDINNYPLDEHGNGIGERDRERGYEDHNESYLTYYSRKCWTTLEGLRLKNVRACYRLSAPASIKVWETK